MLSVNPDHTDVGYVNHTLAYFNTKDFQEGTRPLYTQFPNVTTCRYPEYRNPPGADRPYKRPLIYWHILAARLAFIVIFQNVVYFVQMLVAWIVPDTPRKVRENVKREDFQTREIIIKHEKQKTIQRRTLMFLRKQQPVDGELSSEYNVNDGGATNEPNPIASTENEVRKRVKPHGSNLTNGGGGHDDGVIKSSGEEEDNVNAE